MTLFRFFILLYQRTLSPDHGPLRRFYPYGYCRFYPSCSQYALEALEQKGIKSIFRILSRILRCNPWSKGGLDPYTNH